MLTPKRGLFGVKLPRTKKELCKAPSVFPVSSHFWLGHLVFGAGGGGYHNLFHLLLITPIVQPIVSNPSQIIVIYSISPNKQHYVEVAQQANSLFSYLHSMRK